MEAVDSVLDLMDASTGPNEDKGEFLSLNLRVAWVLVLSCSPVPLTTRLIPSIVYTTTDMTPESKQQELARTFVQSVLQDRP